MILENLGKILVLENLKEYLENNFTRLLSEKSLLDPDFYLCGLYISSLINNYVKQSLKNFWIFEQQLQCQKKEGCNPYELEVGGQRCFLFCVFYSGLAKRRIGSVKPYMESGISFFYVSHQRTGKKISLHMSRLFEELIPLTQEVIEISS